MAPKPCFEGYAEVVAPRSEVSDEEVMLDLLGGGGVFKFVRNRSLRNMESGMASAGLVPPMNCGRYLV